MRNRLQLICLITLFAGFLNAQQYLPPAVPINLTVSGIPIDIDHFGSILSTDDGGYVLVGSFVHTTGRVGLIIKMDAFDNFDWGYFYGNGPNNLQEVFFTDVVQYQDHYYLIGDGVSLNDGRRYPYMQKVPVNNPTSTFVGSRTFTEFPDGKGLTIENGFGASLLIGGYEENGAPSNGDTDGFVRQVDTDLNSIGNPVTIGSKVGKIDRSDASFGYYVFGTQYDATEPGCSTGPQFFTGTPVGNSRGDVFVGRLSINLGVNWTRILGGVSNDTYRDGVATSDGGFAVLGLTQCESSSGGQEGPNNVCNDLGFFRPYWVYKGTSFGNLSWTKSIDHVNTGDTRDPFGLIESCNSNTFAVGYNSSSFSGFHVGLDRVSQASDQEFLDNTVMTFDNQDYRGFEVIRDENTNEILIGGTEFTINDDFGYDRFAYFRFSSEQNCCPSPVFYDNCEPNITYTYQGFGLDYEFQLSDVNNYFEDEPWFIDGLEIDPFGSTARYEFSEGGEIEVCYPIEDFGGCLSYCCETFCIDFQEDCLEGVIPPCPGQCACSETDPNLPAPFQCETFQGYQNGGISPQSNFWRRQVGQSDADVENMGGDRVLRLESENPDQEVIYQLYNGMSEDLMCGRYRLSWTMFVETGAAASYSLQYLKDDVGDSNNQAYEVVFNSDGTGFVSNGVDPQRTFNYLQGFPIQVMQIIDLDQGNDGIVEFWIDGAYKFTLDYGAAANGGDVALGAIDFLAETNGGANYWIDDICIRTTDSTVDCSQPDEPVCVNNGEQYNNICDANKRGLYALGEFGECLSICQYNAEFIGRSTRTDYGAALTTANSAPSLVLSEPCVSAAYQGEIPSPLYGDLFLFENTTGEPINVSTDSLGTTMKAFIFQCTSDVNGEFQQICLGEASDLEGVNQPNGFYYILIVGGETEDYSFTVTPSTPCLTAEVQVLSCVDNTYTGGFLSGQDVFDATANNDAYANCYGGLRTYQLEEQVFRLEIASASIVDVSLSATGGAAGVFVYNSACGSNCVNYAEAPDAGGTVQLNDLTLAAGNYYLVVDQETPVSEFSLNVFCESDDNNDGMGGVFTVTGVTPPDCELSDETHEVRVQIDNLDQFVAGEDRFSFNLPEGGLNNPSLGQAFSGIEPLEFLLPQSIGAETCSFLPGDSMQLFLYRSNEAGITTFPQKANFASANVPGLNAEGRYVENGMSVITSFTNDSDPIHISYPTSFAFPAAESTLGSYLQVSTAWLAEISDDWINLNVTQGSLSRQLNITVDENPTFLSREGFIVIQTVSPPFVSQTVQISQRGRCAQPQVITSVQSSTICQGETVNLEVLSVGPGPPSVYSYRWSTGETTASIAVSPTESETYSVTISQEPGDYCRATEVRNFEVLVSSTIPMPVPTTEQVVAVCADRDFNEFVVTTDESLYQVNWYNTTDPNTPLLEDDTSFTPEEAGTYFAVALDRTNPACRSSQVLFDALVVPVITATPNWSDTTVCVGSLLLLNASTTGGGGGYNYTWRDEGGVVQGTINPFFYTPSIPGDQVLTLDISDFDGFCMTSLDYTISVLVEPAFTNYTAPTDADCSSDLTSYSISFSTDGELLPPGVGILDDDSNGNYVITGITTGVNFTLESTNGTCTSTLEVVSPSCACPPDIPAPISAGDEVACAGGAYPTLMVSVEDEATYGVNWYNDAGEQVASNTYGYLPAGEGPGTYTARAFLRESPACEGSVEATVTLTELPAITINTNPAVTEIDTCVGETINFIAVASGGQGALQYEWRQDDLLLGSNPFLPYNVSVAGEAVVELIVTDASGLCSAERSFTINSANRPTLGIEVGTTCSEDLSTYSFSLTTTAVQSIATDEPDAMIDDSNAGMGIYTISNVPVGTNITVTAENTEGSAVCTESIVVNSPANCNCSSIDVPDAEPVRLVYPVCEGATYPALMVEDPGENYRVLWFEEATSSDPFRENTTFYVPTEPGTWYVALEDIDNECRSTTLVAISLVETENPTANAGEDISACAGDIITLDATFGSSGSTALSYEWSPGTQLMNPNEGITTGTLNQSEVLTLTVTDENGCMDTDVLILTAFPVPMVGINTLQDISCFGDSTGVLQAVVNGGTPPNQLTWSNGEVNVGVISDLVAGDYSLVVVDDNECSATADVSITQPPLIELLSFDTIAVADTNGVITPGEISVVIGGGVPEYMYNWLDGNGISQSTMPMTFITDVAGSYTLQITDANECRVLFPDLVIRAAEPVIIDDVIVLDDGNELVLYPNPTRGRLRLGWSEAIAVRNMHCRILDARGRELGTYRIDPLGLSQVEFDLTHLPDGTYWLQLLLDDEAYNLKFLKTR